MTWNDTGTTQVNAIRTTLAELTAPRWLNTHHGGRKQRRAEAARDRSAAVRLSLLNSRLKQLGELSIRDSDAMVRQHLETRRAIRRAYAGRGVAGKLPRRKRRCA